MSETRVPLVFDAWGAFIFFPFDLLPIFLFLV
jgi:hypothetical protein